MRIKQPSEKNYTIISLVIVGYFVVLYLMYIYKIKDVFSGFLRELLTLPMMMAELLFLGIGIRFLIKGSPLKISTKIAMLFLGLCVIFTIGGMLISFF